MLRVTTIRASTASVTARYYTGYLTKEEEELPGLWAGEQARQLGLIGDVTAFDLEELLSGRDPVSGRALGREFVDRVTKDGRVVSPVAGFDATFSAPKSLSVWWALTGDDGLAQCHDVAVTAAVSSDRAVRGHHPDPVERVPVASRHGRVDGGVVPPDDVTVG